MDDLIAFWRARLDESEHFANVARLAQKHRDQMLREVAADRAILTMLQTPVVDGRERDYDATDVLEQVTRWRVSVYSDHPDYRAKWAPTA